MKYGYIQQHARQSADCKVAELFCVVHAEKTQSKLCLPGGTEILAGLQPSRPRSGHSWWFYGLNCLSIQAGSYFILLLLLSVC